MKRALTRIKDAERKVGVNVRTMIAESAPDGEAA